MSQLITIYISNQTSSLGEIKNMSELPQITSEFLEKNKKLCQSRPKSHKPGPYTKSEKETRRDDVYRFHFDYGYSARKISELMKINRNTINGDVDYWNVQIINNSNVLDPEPSILVSIQRFDVQRSGLREDLDKAENFQQRHAIRKMIFDIDCKIINTQMKLADTMKRIHDIKIDYLNTWLKKNGKDTRFLTFFDEISVSDKAYQKIYKIIKEDRIKTGL